MENTSDLYTLITIAGFIGPFFGLVVLLITISIAIFAVRKFPGTASNLIAGSVVLKIISYILSTYLSYFGIGHISNNDIGFYFAGSNLIATFSSLLFMVGLLLLLKQCDALINR